MTLWKITDEGVSELKTTRFKDEGLLEEHLEDWIAENPDLLGEPLLMVDRQVTIPDVRDQLDLLAVDPSGNAVIIELKRGTIKEPVDIQALRYASYISKWGFDDFEQVAEDYRGGNEEEYNFNAELETFFSDAGIEETPNLNEQQRIIIVGASVREKLGSVVLWLNDHGVDIRLIEVAAYKNDGELIIEPSVIVPVPVSRFAGTGGSPGKRPWRTDGRNWHLDKRCSEKTRKWLLEITERVEEELDLEPPSWSQKDYLVYRVNNRNWMSVTTRVSRLRLNINVRAGAVEAEQLAELLGIEKFAEDESLAEKGVNKSGLRVRNKTENTDRIKLWVLDDFDLEGEAFGKFLHEVFEASRA